MRCANARNSLRTEDEGAGTGTETVVVKARLWERI
jgi:hypothetical protein